MTRPGRPKTGAPTLREIASRTGYGLMTVSRALGPAPESVATEKRHHIQAVADALGYRPNLNIRALRRGYGTLIGLLCERFDTRAHDILIGLHDTLVPEGFLPCLMVMQHHQVMDGRDAGTAAIQHLIERRVAAILAVLPRPDGLPKWLDVLQREAHDRGMPTLLAGAVPQIAPLPLVRCDMPRAVALLIDHVATCGGRGALVPADIDDPWEVTWERQILQHASHKGVMVAPWVRGEQTPPDAVPIATSDFAALSLTHHGGPPAAWIASSDPAACPLRGLAVDLGSRVLGERAGGLLTDALRGRPLPACSDVPPVTRRIS